MSILVPHGTLAPGVIRIFGNHTYIVIEHSSSSGNRPTNRIGVCYVMHSSKPDPFRPVGSIQSFDEHAIWFVHSSDYT